jgi:hypothetical protein
MAIIQQPSSAELQALFAHHTPALDVRGEGCQGEASAYADRRSSWSESAGSSNWPSVMLATGGRGVLMKTGR